MKKLCTLFALLLLSVLSQAQGCFVTATNVDVACNGQCTGSASATAVFGVAPYTFSWIGPNAFSSSSQNITGLCPGNYIVTMTAANGCTSVSVENVSQNPSLGLATSTTATSCSSCTGTATANASGGTAPYTYVWSTTPVQNTATATGLCAGTYTVTANDNACTTSQTVTITSPSTLTFTTSTTTSSCSSCTGTATASASGGTGPYTYSWTTLPVQNTATATGLCGGTTYTITVTDANSCATYKTVVIPVTSGGSISTNSTASGCSPCTGASFASTSGGVAPYTYSWTTSPIQTTSLATGLCGGTYTVTATDANSCTTSKTVSITVTPSGSLSTNSTVSACSPCTGTSTASTSGGTGPYTYSWTTLPVQNTATATGLCGGTIYTVTGTDANGCTTSKSDSITLSPSGSLSTNSTVSACSPCTGTASANTSGGTAPYTYSWNTSPVQNTATATGLCGATSYTVTSIDANGCTTSKTASITVTPSGSLNTTSTSSSCTSCTGVSSASTSGGTAPYTYSWSTIPVQNTATATGLCGGTYTVTSTDANGCTTSQIVLVNSGSIAAAVSVANVSCFGACDGVASASASGGTAPYTYSWNTSPAQTNQVVAGLCAGTYILTVTDAIGCVASKMVIINQPASALTANPASTGASCGTCPDGTTSANVSGGTSPYTYNWTPSGCTTPTCLGLLPGSYTVCVTDANGCTQCKAVTVNFATGTTEIPSENNISLYPNPATESITMEINFETQTKVEVSVCNMLGEQVYSETMEARQAKKIIPVAKLPGGIYFIQTKTDSGIFLKKFIRQ